MKIAMIGSGYVGLVSGVCFADFGHQVVCVDKDPARIEALLRGEIPIFEPGLDDLVADNVRNRRLSFTTDLAEAVAEAEVVFIAVGTPSRRGDGFADLSYIYAAAREIAKAIKGFTVVVTKSTVPVGTGDEVERIISRNPPRRRIRRLLQSGIFARRRGDRRFQAARPHCRRRQRPARPRGDERSLSAAQPQPAAALFRRPAHGRADQIRRQFLPGDQGHLHQRNRRPVREGRGQCAGCRARHGHGQSHRLEIPACRAGLRRLVLPQGHSGPGQDGAGSRLAAAHRRSGGGGQ